MYRLCNDVRNTSRASGDLCTVLLLVKAPPGLDTWAPGHLGEGCPRELQGSSPGGLQLQADASAGTAWQWVGALHATNPATTNNNSLLHLHEHSQHRTSSGLITFSSYHS